MPGFDGTGPQGAGPMTGGGRGFCALPYGSSRGFYGRGRGYGMGMGYGRGAGRGRGFRNRYFATGLPGWSRWGCDNPYHSGPEPMSLEDERALLQEEANAIRADLKNIENRLKELENKSEKESE